MPFGYRTHSLLFLQDQVMSINYSSLVVRWPNKQHPITFGLLRSPPSPNLRISSFSFKTKTTSSKRIFPPHIRWLKNKTKQNKVFPMLQLQKCAQKGGDWIEIGVKHIGNTVHQLQQSQSTAGQGHIVQAGVSNQLSEEDGGQQEVCFCVCSSVWVWTIGASVLACTCALKKETGVPPKPWR